jgi:hypothetical protein
MKRLLMVVVTMAIVISIVPALAQESILPPNVDKALVEKNLLIGLSTENLGLQRSCALMLGQIQADNAVIPLMAALKSNDNEGVRIAAAWALCQLGDARGEYAVKMATKFDNSYKVQAACAWYYETYVQPGTFTFTQPKGPELVATVE